MFPVGRCIYRCLAWWNVRAIAVDAILRTPSVIRRDHVTCIHLLKQIKLNRGN
jgi:hypothetical protein